MEKRCGNCLWHFDLTGVNGDGEERNCLAAPSHMVEAIWMTKQASCMFPDRYEKVEKLSIFLLDIDSAL